MKAKRKRIIDHKHPEYVRGYSDGQFVQRGKERGAKGEIRLGTLDRREYERDGHDPAEAGFHYIEGLNAGLADAVPIVDGNEITWRGETRSVTMTSAVRILHELVQHPGKAIHIAKLKKVAGLTSATDARLRGAVRDLREVLREYGWGDLADHVQSVRGVGYAYRPEA